eukprot:2669502-Prymnesium_polylepis.1
MKNTCAQPQATGSIHARDYEKKSSDGANVLRFAAAADEGAAGGCGLRAAPRPLACLRSHRAQQAL